VNHWVEYETWEKTSMLIVTMKKTLLSTVFGLAALIGSFSAYAAAPGFDGRCISKEIAIDEESARTISSRNDCSSIPESGNPAPETASSPGEGSGQTVQSMPSTVGKAQRDRKTKKKAAHRGTIVLAPLPIVSPAIGSGIIPILGYIFPFSKEDKVSPPSVIGAAGLVTNDGSRGFGVGADLFMKKDTYEVTSLYAHGNVNYNLYGVGIDAGNAGLKIPLEQSGQIYFGEVLRRIKWQFFLGPRFWTGSSVITVRPTNQETSAPPPDVGLHTTLRALGVRLNRDTRANRFYPTNGMLLQFTTDFFAEALGSKYSFQSYRLTANKYASLGKDQVLAYNFFGCATGGKPPFYANCVYGTSNELRGYEAGRYLDRNMFATQLEYRLSLPKGFGLAGFGGVGAVFPGGSQLLRSKNFLPDIGGGPRYELSKKYHVNLRADFARGKGSWTWSMGVGEAF
jgi:hypothetical protein